VIWRQRQESQDSWSRTATISHDDQLRGPPLFLVLQGFDKLTVATTFRTDYCLQPQPAGQRLELGG
jgi:hypothetical protein